MLSAHNRHKKFCPSERSIVIYIKTDLQFVSKMLAYTVNLRIQAPASIGTIRSDTRLVIETRFIFLAKLQVIRHNFSELMSA